ncbi:hypothetical protein V8E55_008490, partial [Tylopilus felleus]
QPVVHVTKDWTLPVYAFFELQPQIVVMNGQHAHKFRCCAHRCKYIVCWFLDTADPQSTSNMWKHVKSCWGPDVL